MRCTWIAHLVVEIEVLVESTARHSGTYNSIGIVSSKE